MNRRVGRGPRPSDAWTRRSGCTPRHLRAWWRHPALLYFTLLYSTLRYSTLLYSTLLYFTLLYPTLLYSTLLYFTLLYSALLYSTLLYFSRESTFYLYFVKVESGLSRNDRLPNPKKSSIRKEYVSCEWHQGAHCHIMSVLVRLVTL